MLGEPKQGELFLRLVSREQGAGAGAGVDEQRLRVRWWERAWMWERLWIFHLKNIH